MIRLTKKQKQIITEMLINNGTEFNFSKSSEECQELALALTQKLNKKLKMPDQNIIDEIGDVYIRLKILMKMFPEHKIQERIDYKLSKFKEYQDHKLYSKM